MRLIVVLAAGLAGSMLVDVVSERSHASAQSFHDSPFYDDSGSDRQDWNRFQDQARERAERRRERYMRRDEQWRNRQLDRRNRELDQRNRELDERNREIARRQRERSRATNDW